MTTKAKVVKADEVKHKYVEGSYQEADGTAKYYLVDEAGTKVFYDSYEDMKKAAKGSTKAVDKEADAQVGEDKPE